jgi:hypothetical protein
MLWGRVARFPIDTFSDRTAQRSKSLSCFLGDQFRRDGRDQQHREANGCETNVGHEMVRAQLPVRIFFAVSLATSILIFQIA